MRPLKVCARRFVPIMCLTTLAFAQAPLRQPKPDATVQKARVAAAYGKLPLSFEPNQGQAESSVNYVSRGRGYTLFLKPGETVLALRRAQLTPTSTAAYPSAADSTAVSVLLIGATKSAQIAAEQPLPGHSNYFIGNNRSKWRTNVPTYGRVRYSNIYPGIDLVYYGNQRLLEHDFELAPGAEPQRIRMIFRGADGLRLEQSGDLVMQVSGGELRLQKPLMYQEVQGSRREIAGGFVLHEKEVGFEVGAYDRSKKLIIDPVLVYSTYFGGAWTDTVEGVAVNAAGELYFTGQTTGFDLLTANPHQAGNAGGADAFVAKLSVAGNTLVFSTYLGGGNWELGKAIAVDGSGNAYVGGTTWSTDFPTLGTSVAPMTGGSDGFVSVFDPSGVMTYSSYFGGGGLDIINGLAVHTGASTDVYVAGTTYSTSLSPSVLSPVNDLVYKVTTGATASTTFTDVGLSASNIWSIKVNPVTPSTVYAGSSGGFFISTDAGATFTASNSGLGVSEVKAIATSGNGTIYVAGSGVWVSHDSGATWSDTGYTISGCIAKDGLLLDAAGNLYVGSCGTEGVYWLPTGTTTWQLYALDSPVPGTSPGAIRALAASSGYVYVGTDFGLWRCIGPSNCQQINWNASNSIAVDPTNSLHLLLATSSGVQQSTDGGVSWGTVATLYCSVAFAGNSNTAYALVPYQGIFESVSSGPWNLVSPITRNMMALGTDPSDPNVVYAGRFAELGFAAKFTPGNSTLTWGTYLGGASAPNTTEGFGIAVDALGNAYVVGETVDGNFPYTLGSFKGGNDGYLVALNGSGGVLYAVDFGGSSNDFANAVTVDGANPPNVYVTGQTYSSNFTPLTASFQQASAGGSDAFVAKIAQPAPTSPTVAFSSYLGGQGDDIGRAIAVDGGGNIWVTGQTSADNFPTANAYQWMRHGGRDGFLSEVASDGSKLVFSSYFGGNFDDDGRALAIDGAGALYLGGQTASSVDFPLVNALQSQYWNLGGDGFLTKFASTGHTDDIAIVSLTTNQGTSVAAGTPVTFTALLENQGTDPLGGNNVELILRTSATLNSAPAYNFTMGTPPSGCSIFGEPAGTIAVNLRCAFTATMPPGATQSVSFTVTPTAAETLMMSAQVSSGDTDTNSANNYASAVTTVVAAYGVNLDLSHAVDPVGKGTNVSEAVKLTNLFDPINSSNIIVTLPAGGAFVSSFSGCYAGSPGQVNCPLSYLGSGLSTTLYFVYSAPATPGTYTATATATTSPSSTYAPAGNLTDILHVTNSADLSVSVGSGALVPVGGNVTVTYTVNNNGPDATTNVQLSNVLPPGATFYSYKAGTATCSFSGSVHCTIPNMGVGSNEVISFTFSLSAQGVFTVPVSVSGPDADPNGNNNASYDIVSFTSMGSNLTTLVTDGIDSQLHLLSAYDLFTTFGTAAVGGQSPSSAVVTPNGRLAFVANPLSNYISVFDLTIQAEITRIRGVTATALAISASGKTVVGVSNRRDEIFAIDSSTFQVQKVSFDGQVGDSPGIADVGASSVALVGKQAFVNTTTAFPVIVVDFQPTTPSISTIGGTGNGTTSSSGDHTIAATPDGSTVAVLRSGSMFLIDSSKHVLIGAPVTLPSGWPKGIVITPDAYTSSGVYGYVSAGNTVNAIDLRNGSGTFGQILANTNVNTPFGVTNLAITPDGNELQIVGASSISGGSIARLNTNSIRTSPGVAVIQQGPIGTSPRALTIAYIQSWGVPGSPWIGEVTPWHITNEAPKTIQISGNNFGPGAMVRFGNLDPLPANVLSPELIEVVVPQGAAVQEAEVIVTVPNLSGDPLTRQVSGKGYGQGKGPDTLRISPPATFAPKNPVIASTPGSNALSIITLDSAMLYGAYGRALAISPDGKYAYYATVNAVNIIDLNTGIGEGSVPLFSSPGGGASNGLVIAPDPVTGNKSAFFVTASATSGADDLLTILDVDPASAGRNTSLRTIAANLGNFKASQALAVTPDGHYVYSVDTRTDGSVKLVIFDVVTASANPSTVATVIDMTSLGVNPSQLYIHMTPDGNALIIPDVNGNLKVHDISGTHWNAPLLVATISGSGAPQPTNFGSFQVVATATPRLFAWDSAQSFVQVFDWNWSSKTFAPLGSYTIQPVASSLLLGPMIALPDGSLIYTALRDEDAVAVLDGAKVTASDPTALITKIRTGIAPNALKISPLTSAASDLAVNTYTNPVSPLGQSMVFDASVQNNGPSTATGVSITLQLPVGATVVSALAYNDLDPSLAAVPCTGTVQLSCAIGTVPTGSTGHVVLVLTPVALGSYSVTATGSADQIDPNPADNTSTASATVDVGADLGITASASADPVALGTPFNINITVTNHGSDIANNVIVSFGQSTGLSGGNPVPSQGTCPPASNYCDLGTLNPGAVATITGTGVYISKPQPVVTLTSTVGATTSDPDPSNNSFSLDMHVTNPAAAVEHYFVLDRGTGTVQPYNSDNTPATDPIIAGVSPNSIAISPNRHTAFVANVNANYISVLDLSIQKEIHRIRNLRAGTVALTSDGSRLIAPLVGSDSVAIVDALTFQVLQQVDLNGKFGDNAANTGDIFFGSAAVVGNLAFVSSRNFAPIVAVDAVSYGTTTLSSGLSGIAGNNWSSMAATPDGAYVLAVRQNPTQLLMINAGNGTVWKTFAGGGTASSGSTVLNYGSSFNLDAGNTSSPYDIWWNPPQMNVQSGATLANMGTGLAFSNVTITDLQNLTYSSVALNNSQLVVGDIFAVHTKNGNYAKVLVTSNTGASIGFQWETLSGPPVNAGSAIAITHDASDPNGVWGYVSQGAKLNVIDLRPTSPNFGSFVSGATASLQFSPSNLAVSADGNRLYAVSNSAFQTSNNFAQLDTAQLRSNPGASVLMQSRIGTRLTAVASAPSDLLPEAGAPVIAEVKPAFLINSTPTLLHIVGSGFAADAVVEVERLGALPVTFISGNELRITIPVGASAGDSAVIVTNPNTVAPASGQLLSAVFDPVDPQKNWHHGINIERPVTYQPKYAVFASDAGGGRVSSVENRWDNSFVGSDPMGFVFSPDGTQLYVENLVGGVTLGPNNGPNPMHISMSGQPGQTEGIALAPDPVTGQPVAYVVSSYINSNPAFTDEQLTLISADPYLPSANTVIGKIRANLNDTGSGRGALAVTPDGHYVYANSQGTTPRLVIFDVAARAATAIPTATLGVADFQFQMFVTSDGKHLLLSGINGEIKVFSLNSPTAPSLVATITGTTPPSYVQPWWGAFKVVGNHLYAFDPAQNLFEIFNFNYPTPGDFSFRNYFAVPGHTTPLYAGIAVTPDEALTYVAVREDDTLAVIDNAKLLASAVQGDPTALVTNVAAGLGPQVLAINPRKLDTLTEDLAISITHTPEPVGAGSTITYQVTVTNLGQNFTGLDTGGTGFGVSLDPSLTFVSSSFMQNPNLSCFMTGPTFICDAMGLPVGQSYVGNIVAQTSTPGTVTTNAVVGAGDYYDPDGLNNQATDNANVAAADLSIAVTPSAGVVAPGSPLTYTVTVSNYGPSAASGVTVTDVLPANLTIQSYWTGCSGTVTITCAVGSLAPGASFTFSINVTPNAVGAISNTLTVAGTVFDPDLTNNTVTVISNSNAADLVVTAAAAPPGSFAITVTNNGPMAASNVVVTDTLDRYGYIAASVTPNGTCTYTAPVVSCFGWSMNVGETSTITVTVQAPSSGWASNVFHATATEPDPNPVNNGVRLGPPADAYNTITGANVAVLTEDPGDGLSAALTFSSVTRSGNTSMSPTNVPALPAGFRNGRQPLIFNLSTSAQFGGGVALAISFPASNFRHPSKVRLFHLENGAWVDATVALNPAGLVSGRVTSLSPFALLEPFNIVPLASAGPDVVISGASAAGAAVKLDGSASSDGDADPLTYRWSGPFPEGGGTVTGATPAVTLPLGRSKVTLVVNDGEADSALVTMNVAVTDFALSGPAGIAAIRPGQSATYTITAAAQFGAFANTVNLACSTTSPAVTCAFGQSALTPGAAGASVPLTVTAAARAAVAPTSARPVLAFWLGTLPMFGMVLLSTKSRKRRIGILLALLVILVLAHVGCGGGGSAFTQAQQPASNSQNVTVTVTGVSGGLQHSTSFTVVVQQ